MSRASLATPCPAPSGPSNIPIAVPGRRTSTASFGSTQDDTTEIEYTRAINVEFKNAKPRRKSTFQKRGRQEAVVTIFEDLLEDEELAVEERKAIGGTTLLGKPAQRIPNHAVRKRPQAQLELSPVSKAPKTVTSNDGIDQTCDLKISMDGLSEPDRDKVGLNREPRRRTIFVPGDDTSILTIHPGANATDRLNDTFQLPSHVLPSLTENKPAPFSRPVAGQAKRPRMSLAVAPKRIPLQHISAQDGNATGFNVAGCNGGKENMPPGDGVYLGDEKPSKELKTRPARQSLAASKLFEPTAASQARQTIVPRHAVPIPKASNNANRVNPLKLQNAAQTAATLQAVSERNHSRHSPPLSRPEQQSRHTTSQVSSNELNRPSERRVELKSARLQQYPVLSQDLAQPELYEDSWLSHQEIALTELINQIFSTAEPQSKWDDGSKTLTERLIDIYHQPQVTTLYKRLQASLLYGALSRPKDLSSPPNPAQDIGLRKRFLGLWLDSYDTEVLRCVAQVVFGRQLPTNSSSKRVTLNCTLDPHKSRRPLIGFLETFLIEIDDVEEPDEVRGDDPHARWRKMVLRCFMLIWLLDRAKESGAIPKCLFKSASPRKSSLAMLHALAGMLIPSIGDVARVLRHLDYQVQHVQDPLDEVGYRIQNIAVDLRDGILLTRLVEILLFSASRMRTAESSGDATVTIRMPDLTILESALYYGHQAGCPRILSQHLKMPCIGQAQKLYNVQVAISALRDHGRLSETAFDVTAEDVVDGHREKTLSLLWLLVSTHGLGQLLDFKALAVDIKRSGNGVYDSSMLLGDNDDLSQTQQESLLKKWASTNAARQGVRIGNLTTSFADGKAYAAILDAFTELISPNGTSYSTSRSSGTSLEAQLRDFGCSNAFIKQLSSTSGTIPSRKTTISNLAFLASHLVPLSRRHNAAIAIQRAFRIRRSRNIASNRIALMRLAYACATVVQTQNRLVSAATVLQRAWRNVLDTRLRLLNADIESFQSAAKAWLSRRKTRAGMSVLQRSSLGLKLSQRRLA